jgi:glutathione synthase/RimK-type ligase-like ATP-grasp enzyme
MKLAILINPKEELPPSDKEGIEKFIQIGARMGVTCTVVDREVVVEDYDGIFFRETTSPDNYTYDIACKAKELGLSMVDDPTSILLGSDKLIQHRLFHQHGLSYPYSMLLTEDCKKDLPSLSEKVGFPIVVKLPKSSFSNGVYKVHNLEELVELTERIFSKSSTLILQEYLYTEYDWRVGILNGQPLYVCKYYMAAEHWQIYNHKYTDSRRYGKWETLSVEDAPTKIVSLALQACKFIGNGLYGVDLKEVKGISYLIEVNDNPSLETEIEDAVLGDLLYEKILQVFLTRYNKNCAMGIIQYA